MKYLKKNAVNVHFSKNRQINSIYVIDDAGKISLR